MAFWLVTNTVATILHEQHGFTLGHHRLETIKGEPISRTRLMGSYTVDLNKNIIEIYDAWHNKAYFRMPLENVLELKMLPTKEAREELLILFIEESDLFYDNLF